MRLNTKRLFGLVIIIFIILILLSLPLKPFTSAEPCAILKVSLPNGTYADSSVSPWLSECWQLNLTGFSQTFIVRINNTSAIKRSYDTRLVIALNDVGYANLQSLVVNGTSVPKSAFEFNNPQPYGLWDWPSGDVYPTWFEDTHVNVGTIYRKSYKNVVVSVTFSSANGIMMHFDAYGNKISGTPCNPGYITHNSISEDSTVSFNGGQLENQPPTADFFYTPPYPTSYESVTLNASASYDPDGHIISYHWDFGDGTPIVVESNPITYHTYTSYGIFMVNLTVTDDDGLTDYTASPINVRQRPVAAFTFSPIDPMVCENVTFDASSSTPDGGVLISYAWDFGDGTPIIVEDGPIIIHHYTQDGTFTVTLNVTDSECGWDTESKQITVNPRTYHHLTVETSPEGITTIPGEGLYENGTNVNLEAPQYVPDEGGVEGQRYKFDHWDIDGDTVSGNPIVVCMTTNHTATAHYVLQYLITFAHTGLDDTSSGTVVTVNGEPKTFSDLLFYFWADDGSSVTYEYSLIVSTSVSGKRFRLDSIGGLPSPFIVTEAETITGNYKTQYLLTFSQSGLDATATGTVVTINGVPKSYGALPNSTWFDSGATVTYSYIDVSSSVSGKRFKLDSVSGPSSSITVDAPATIVGNYSTQYYLTITHTSGGITDPAASGWYNAGTTASVTAIPDSEYVLDRWELDGTPVGSANPYGILMNSAHTLHAVFAYSPSAYYLVVKTDPMGVTPIPGEGWYDAGEDVVLTAPNFVDVSSGTRYKFSFWDIDGTPQGAGVNPITVHMGANHTVTAHYTLQYYLTVTSAYDSPTPVSGWFNAGSSITASVTSPWAGSTGTRYVCTGWTGTGSVPPSGSGTSAAFTINEPSSITWNWKTQYYLTVKTKPSGLVEISGEGWYDVSTSVPLTAPKVLGYDFRFWDIDSVSQGSGVKSISVVMDAPHTATANYALITVGGVTASIPLPSVNAWIASNILLFAAILIGASWVKRLRKR